MPETTGTLVEPRPRVVINRPLVTRLLDELDLLTVRERAEYLGTSISVTYRLLREPSDEHPGEHHPDADTIAAVCFAFPNTDMKDLLRITGGKG